MLLRFRAGNYLSLREPQELSLVASKAIKDDVSGLVDMPGVDEKLVPASIIYGANASGKSNVVRALEYMRLQVLHSHVDAGAEKGFRLFLNRGEQLRPFALDPSFLSKPSTFDIDFIVDGVRYHYGFHKFKDKISREWLEAFPSGRSVLLFSREDAEFKFGRSLKGQNAVTRDLTRPDSLFLSVATQNNHEQLSSVSAFFRKISTEIADGIPGHYSLRSERLEPRVLEFLNRVGAGIVDSRIVESDSALVTFGGSDSPVRLKEIQLGHRGVSNEPVYFSLHQESAGTRRLLGLLRGVYRALDEGAVMVVDEIDASLHTQACEVLVGLFCSPKSNPLGAQLIATTHDTNLLRSRYVRRDQIWFTEKDELGATHLYPLTDIATRQGENIEKGYLHGRYGAVPFAGSVSDLFVGE